MSQSIIETPSAERNAGPEVAARSAAAVTAGYLLLTWPLLLASVLPAFGGPAGSAGRGEGPGAGAVAVLAVHAALAAGLLVRARGRAPGGGPLRVLVDWLPLLLVPLLYAELPLLMEGVPGTVRYHDPLISALEQAAFGGQPAFDWAGAWPVPALSELLHAAYFSYYPLIYVPPLLLYLGVTGGAPPAARAAFHRTVVGLALAFFLCFAVFAVFPVQGPRYLGVPAGVPDGPVRSLVLAVLESGSSRGAAFPSSHVAVAVAQALLALRFQPRVGAWVAALALGLALGAVYGGFHYAVDVLAGAAVGALAVPLAGRLCSGGRSP